MNNVIYENITSYIKDMESLFTRIECRNPLLHLLDFLNYFEIKTLKFINKYMLNVLSTDLTVRKLVEVKRERSKDVTREYLTNDPDYYPWEIYPLSPYGIKLSFLYWQCYLMGRILSSVGEIEKFLKFDRVNTNYMSYAPHLLHILTDQKKLQADLIHLVFKYMKSRRIEINSSNGLWICYLCKKDKPKLLTYILKYPYLNLNRYDFSETFIIAAENGHERMIEVLIQDGRISVNSLAITKAQNKGFEKIAKLLMDAAKRDSELDILISRFK